MKQTILMKKLLAFLVCITTLGGVLPATADTGVGEAFPALASMVFAIDNSLAMYNFDCGEENGWLDAYAGIMEQAPENSEFAVVTQHGVSPLMALEAAETALYDIPFYRGMVDPVILLTEAANVLSVSSGRKFIVLSSTMCYNNSELENKIRELTLQGIDVRVIAFEAEAGKTAELEAAYEKTIVCRDVRELPILLGDWYAELATMPIKGPSLFSVETTTYNSSFRESKHKYEFCQNKFQVNYKHSHGIILSELLNMYYFLPTWVDGGYKIEYAYMCKEIAKGNTAGMYPFTGYPDAKPLLDYWGDHAQILLESDDCAVYSPQGISDEMLRIMKENLRRRMPVMLSMNDTAYLVTAFHEPDQTFDLIDASGGQHVNRSSSLYVSLPDVRLIDTGKYFNILRSGTYISDDHKGGTNSGKEVKITLPPNYRSGTDTDYLQVLKTTNSSALVTFLGLTGSTARYWAQPNVEFVVGVKVQYDGIKPNCYNATRNYVIKVYPDVDNNAWYADYVFDLTNKGLILGGENNGVFGFWPNDPITVAEFLIIMYRAADIAGYDMTLPNEEERTRVVQDAFHNGWITSDSGDLEDSMVRQAKLGLGLLPNVDRRPRPIRRQEAADMLWHMFNAPECRATHQLIEYDLKNTDYLKDEWESYSDLDDFTIRTGWEDFEEELYRYKNSFHQLFLNGVFAGYEDHTFLPMAGMTRGEACKIVSKALYSLADIGETLDPVFDENDIQTLTLGTQVRGNLSEYGGRNFKIDITEPGYYYVTGSNLRLHLTDYAGNAIPMCNPNQREYRIESAHPVYLYVSGASSAAYTLSFNKREDGYVGPSLLEFTKSADSNFIYVNNPEYITKWDIIDDEDTKRLKFIEQTATGKNTFYETHAAWWGDYPERFEPKQSFYMDVDFYNPGDTPVTVSIRNLAYGSDYPVLQSYFTGGINKEITIKAKEHVLLFEYLNAPLRAEFPGSHEDVPPDGDWYARMRKPTILFDFEVSEDDSIMVSSLAAYDRKNLRLRKGYTYLLDNGGYHINSGDVVFDFDARINEADLYNKYKGIAQHQSAWIDAELNYTVDDTSTGGQNLRVQQKDPYYSEVWGPSEKWITHLNGLNDDYGAHLFIMPETLHAFTYHHKDTERQWRFAFDYRNTKRYMPEGTLFDPLNEPIPNTVIEQLKSDVATGQNHFNGNPDPYSIGFGSWGVTYHYTITVQNTGSKARTLDFKLQNYANAIAGYKAQNMSTYDTRFSTGVPDGEWWIPFDIPIPPNSTTTFEIVVLTGGGHGGTTYNLVLNDA